MATKEPYMAAKEPCMAAKEPCMAAKEPCMAANEPHNFTISLTYERIMSHMDESRDL